MRCVGVGDETFGGVRAAARVHKLAEKNGLEVGTVETVQPAYAHRACVSTTAGEELFYVPGVTSCWKVKPSASSPFRR